MTYQEYLKQHTVAADYKEDSDHHCETVPMVSNETAIQACVLAVYKLAQMLIGLSDSKRTELLERIIAEYNSKHHGTD